ncbi:MAG TPA: pitrilysin family protein [Candidatus Paceibacterota bacterium]
MPKVTHKVFKFIQTVEGVCEYLHKRNGLRVLIWEDHSAPVVALNVTYLVGSRNEAVGHTGATHLLEHLMFKGSRKFDNKKGKSIAGVLERVGAQMNATTGPDRTNYYEVVPAEHAELAFAVESDRMRGALLRAEDKLAEMPVVRNEFEIYENEPSDALQKALWATAFQGHPYAYYVIGLRSDIENVSIERLREFYDDFYWPNNAYVVVVGDMNTKEALALTDKHFGNIKRSPKPIPPMYTKEAPQEGARRTTVRRPGEVPLLAVAHKVAPALSPDTPALELLASILGRGRSSRLYKALVPTGFASSVSTSYDSLREGGLLESNVVVHAGKDLAEVEKLVLAEYGKLKRFGVTRAELAKATSQLKFDLARSRDGVYNRAYLINEFISMGDWTYYFKLLGQMEKVSARDVKEIAIKYLGEDNSTTAVFIPKKP